VLITSSHQPAASEAAVLRSAPAPRFSGKRTGMVVFSSYPADPRPRRAVDALLSEGMKIDLICEADQAAPTIETPEGLEVIRIPIKHRRGGALAYAYEYFSFIFLSGLIFAWRSMRRRYDLIYVHNMPDILVFSALIPKILGAKVILDQHDPMPELMKTIFGMKDSSFGVRLMLWLEKRSIAFADRVVTVSVTFQRLFAKRSCTSSKVGVVMNSPDEAIFSYREACSWPSRGANKPFVIMYHGSLVERNGLELAVDALALLHEKVLGAQLTVYGRKTPYLETVMEKVRNLHLENCVQYCGPKTLEELVQEVAKCDVGVIPNPRNTFTDINTPTRIFEYLSQGKPVIAPRTRGIEDYFGEDELLFFESGNASDLAKKLEYAAAHPGEMTDFAERGQRVYRAHAWRQQKECLVQLVAELIQRRGFSRAAA
jgi:glycosyltransferase involved in cell wall biosynthesis